ncbi:MAG: stage III sporulation protein AA [Clostridia bacterium]|nr:stage III sporulation protein AA [Clostridia bacterium]
MEQTESYNQAVKMLCGELSAVLLRISERKKSCIQEIRLRSGKPVALTDGSETLFLSSGGEILYSPGERAFVCTQRHIFDSFKSLCGYSVYSRQNEINQGFLTAGGGYRIGICGTAAMKNGEVTAVTNITSLNLRISRQIFGISDELIAKLHPIRSGILIAGAPSTGKTTMLRDLAYNLSLGKGCSIMRTCVIDERGEISGGYNERCGIDLGLCDVLQGYPKGEGIMQAVRSLSPQVIICDEVGTDSDAQAVAKGANAGAYIVATVHASGYEELMKRSQARKLLDTGAFGTVVILGSTDRPCKITQMINV